jgi:hypothetical protein
MTAKHARRSTASSRNRFAPRAARRWIAIPILLALLGAGAGVAVGYTAKPSAETLLLVQTDATDAVASERAVESTAIELNTRGFFSAVVRGTGKDPQDQQARTRIAVKPNSHILSIVVTAPSTAQAVAQTNAIANEALAVTANRVRVGLDQLTVATENVIDSQGLTGSRAAERARVVRLGDELGAGQAALLSDANRLQLLQSAQPARRLPATPVLGLMGALAGALLGIGLALMLGRRGTVKSERELNELYPETAVIDAADINNVITMERESSTVILAGTPGVDVAGVTEVIRQNLTNGGGRDVVIADRLADVPVNASANGHIHLVPTALTESVVRRAARDERSLLVVPVRPGVTRLETLDHFASRLRDRTYLLINERGHKWN